MDGLCQPAKYPSDMSFHSNSFAVRVQNSVYSGVPFDSLAPTMSWKTSLDDSSVRESINVWRALQIVKEL
jgi:hypothetical protein